MSNLNIQIDLTKIPGARIMDFRVTSQPAIV